MTSVCTPSFHKALQLFRNNIERAIDIKIKNLKEEVKLKSVMDDTRHDLDVATAIVKNLMEKLETTQCTLLKSNTDENCEEVRFIKSAIKTGKTKIKSRTIEYIKVTLEWRLKANLLTEKCQAQKLLDIHFRLQDEEDKLMNIQRK